METFINYPNSKSKSRPNRWGYRPISSISQNAIDTNISQYFTAKYVKVDQGGFIVGRHVAYLTRRVLNAINIIEK